MSFIERVSSTERVSGVVPYIVAHINVCVL